MPFIDFLNSAEKMRIIRSADQLIEIRDLRNQISHEYLPEAITEIVPDLIESCSGLISNIEQTKAFVAKRNW